MAGLKHPTQSLQMNARTNTGNNPDQAREWYTPAYVWLRFRGKPNWASSYHLLADPRARMGCRTSHVGLQHQPVQLRAGIVG